jgi:CRP-like cAMP-binding protein
MALDDDIAILAQAPLFGLMSRDALRLISFAAERHMLAAGEELFHRGTPTDGGYVVLSGTLALLPRHPRGETVLAGPAALVGRNALLVPGRRPTTATARTPCEAMRIAVFPDAAAAIHDAIAEDLRTLNDALASLGRNFAGSDLA